MEASKMMDMILFIIDPPVKNMVKDKVCKANLCVDNHCPLWLCRIPLIIGSLRQ